MPSTTNIKPSLIPFIRGLMTMKMKGSFLLLSLLLLSSPVANVRFVLAAGSEEWGYVEVRPGAHLFWWLYKSPYRVDTDPSKPWPTLLWLQGGPGGSGVGFGNFGEIGPLDKDLNPRNFTWLKKADLLFVDSPVGTGFSYVEDEGLVVKTDYDAADDLTKLLMQLSNADKYLQKSPLYIFAESYGGKFAVTLGLRALEAIEAGQLKLQLGGVALGDSWISPEDYVFSWGPILKDMSRLDDNGLSKSYSLALKIRQQLAQSQFEEATDTWNQLEDIISANSNDVDFYNFMLDEGGNSAVSRRQIREMYMYNTINKGLTSNDGRVNANSFDSLMNGLIREKLKVIPGNVTWGGQSYLVFPAMAGDFMRPRIDEVDKLLSKGINVTIYNGQVDLICATKGTEAWLNKLKWDGLKVFLNQDRIPLYCENETSATKGFLKSHQNLFFYWILGAGHMVPIDQPCISLQMVGRITRSPSKS